MGGGGGGGDHVRSAYVIKMASDTSSAEAVEGAPLLQHLAVAWASGDVCLQLSVAGVGVFLILLLCIWLAWLRYRSVISSVFDTRSELLQGFLL